jgi:hypothetical protein
MHLAGDTERARVGRATVYRHSAQPADCRLLPSRRWWELGPRQATVATRARRSGGCFIVGRSYPRRRFATVSSNRAPGQSLSVEAVRM